MGIKADCDSLLRQGHVARRRWGCPSAPALGLGWMKGKGIAAGCQHGAARPAPGQRPAGHGDRWHGVDSGLVLGP